MCGRVKFVGLHVASLFIYVLPRFPFFVALSSLIFVIWTKLNNVVLTQQIYAASSFVSGFTFFITQYSEKLSSHAIASDPNILYRILNYKAEKLEMVFSSLNDFSAFPHSNTCDFVAQKQSIKSGICRSLVRFPVGTEFRTNLSVFLLVKKRLFEMELSCS